MSTIRIPLRSRKYPGLFAIIDEQDFDLVRQFSWHPLPSRSGVYAWGTIPRHLRDHYHGRVQISMHHVILGLPPRTLVDHKDGDRLNNTRGNLRQASNLQNSHNAKVRSDSKSGFKGVQRHVNHERLAKPWQAKITVNGKVRSLGFHATAEEAARAYDHAAREHFGEFARTNFQGESTDDDRRDTESRIRTDVRMSRDARREWQERAHFQIDPPHRALVDHPQWTASVEIPGHTPREAVAYGNSATLALKALIDGLNENPPVRRTDLPTISDIVGLYSTADEPVGGSGDASRCLNQNTYGA